MTRTETAALPSLNLDYDDCLTRLRSKREWLRSPEARAAFEGLAATLRELGPAPRIAVYGSSWSGYMAVLLLEQAGAGSVDLVFESRDPLPELRHIEHRSLMPEDARAEADCVLLATAPRHYPFIEPLVRAKVDAPLVVGMYAPPEPDAPEDEKDASLEADLELEVNARFGIRAEHRRIPLRRERMALVLIDIWDYGDGQSHYAESVPPLLELARRHDLVVVHAPGPDLDRLYAKQAPALKAPAPRTPSWPPLDFRCRQGDFAWRDRYGRHLAEGGAKPVGIHACAAPAPRPREYVESSLEGVLEIFERHRILFPLYAGGGTLRCLAFKPAGYVNLARRGYQPILVRDATENAPHELDGRMVEMREPGIICFESLCGFSTTTPALRAALEQAPLASSAKDG